MQHLPECTHNHPATSCLCMRLRAIRTVERAFDRAAFEVLALSDMGVTLNDFEPHIRPYVAAALNRKPILENRS